jgi:acyl dehydratase
MSEVVDELRPRKRDGGPMLYFEDLQVGDTRMSGAHELREQEIIDFARQWDPQPWHVDREAAARSPMMGITASSCHTYSVAALLLSRMEPVAGIASLKHELELPFPARPGDVLSLQVTFTEKRPSASKADRGLVTMESVLSNQAGTAVLRLRSLVMIKRRPIAPDARPDQGP